MTPHTHTHTLTDNRYSKPPFGRQKHKSSNEEAGACDLSYIDFMTSRVQGVRSQAPALSQCACEERADIPVAMQNQFQLVSTSTHVLCFPILEKEMENWFCVSCMTAVPLQGSALQHPTVQFCTVQYYNCF